MTRAQQEATALEGAAHEVESAAKQLDAVGRTGPSPRVALAIGAAAERMREIRDDLRVRREEIQREAAEYERARVEAGREDAYSARRAESAGYVSPHNTLVPFGQTL